jgi:dynein heavy chain
MQAIKRSVVAFLEDYNVVNSPSLKLVLFDYALDHLTKICRVVRQPLGHALLLGLPGSGRESLTRLAVYMADRTLFRVDVKQTYGINEWQEDMRKLLRQVGVEGKSVVFLIKDSQVIDEQFLEDVHNLLNSGESNF